MIRVVAGSLVVLVGPSGSGKSTWAAASFDPDQIVSTDRLRAMLGEGEFDQRASSDAFAMVNEFVRRRLRRGLTTVVDSTALDIEFRNEMRAIAAEFDRPCVAVVVRVAPAVSRARNRERSRQVPPEVLTAQIAAFAETLASISGEGFSAVEEVDTSTDDVSTGDGKRFKRARVVPKSFGSGESDGGGVLAGDDVAKSAGAVTGESAPIRIGLAISRFNWSGGASELADRLEGIAVAAERAGVDSLWVMDHFRQIPQVGAVWEDLPECMSTLGFLAGVTDAVRLGSLVAGVSVRSAPLLGRTMATLDVLSKGRMVCGLGIGWYAEEFKALGLPFPSVGERYDALEDTVGLLRAMWAKGSQSFEGKATSVPEAMAYPRPLQARLPIMIGGGGERRTLRLVARHADACNLQGSPKVVAAKLDVLRKHCVAEDRSFSDLEVTHLSPVLIGRDSNELAALIEKYRGRRQGAEKFAALNNAATIEDHVERLHRLRSIGVHTAILSVSDVSEAGAFDRLADLIAALR